MVAKQYRVEGISEEVTTCDHCGKKNLKRTVILVDNETDDELYFGSNCAAEALKWPEKTPSQQLSRAYREVMELRQQYLDKGARYAETLIPPAEVTMQLIDDRSLRWSITCGDHRIYRFEAQGERKPSMESQQRKWADEAVSGWRVKRATEWAERNGMPPVPRAP